MAAVPSAGPWYRRDITGLRSIAIIPVVAFHAGALFLPGGFIGVDVFYVISGFLITTLLVNEAETSGRIRLGTFWAKRVRRLVPALVVVIAVSLPVSALLSSVLSWDDLARQAVASVLYVANILFWRESTSYFDTGSAQSPFLHMWSLGVEEQFYLIWPVLVIGGIWIAARRFRLRSVLTVTFAIVFAGSLALSVFLTPRDPDAAFYLLPTRAWEFAGAGLLALTPTERLVRSRASASIIGVAGLGILMAGMLTISEADLYPGYLALVPFVGTILLIISGAGPSSILRPVFESRPAVWIGNVSYSWYLWHWPLIVFAAALFPGNPLAMAAAGLLSLGVGAASYYGIERPLRFAPILTRSLPRTYLTGAVATGAVAALAFGVFGAGAAVASAPPYRAYAQAAETLPARDCGDGVVESMKGADVCVLGDPDGTTTIALVGDSHAGHWRAAMTEAARQGGYRLIVRWKSACPSTPVSVADEKGVQDASCGAFREETTRILAAAEPDLVIISNSLGYSGKVLSLGGGHLDLDGEREAWSAALTDQITALRAQGSRVAIVDDNPRFPENPTTCLSRLTATPEGCGSTRAEAFAPLENLGRATADVIAAQHIAPPFSISDLICGPEVCHAVDDEGTPVFQDHTHLSRAWTMKRTPAVLAWLRESLARPAP